MEYFKHYSTASDSKSLNKVFDKFGHRGIAFWWMLLELCAENWDGVSEPEFSFHQRTVVTKLKSNLNTVRVWLEFCSGLGLCAFAQCDTQFNITVHNLREIKESRGRIKGNKPEKNRYIKNKNKEEDKDIDKGFFNLKTEKSSSEKITPDRIIQAFNDTLARKAGRIDYCAGLSADQLRDLSNTLSFTNFRKWETWEELFQRVSVSPWLTGQEGSFVATLDWLIIHTNALKVLSGKYPPKAEIAAKNRFEEMELS